MNDKLFTITEKALDTKIKKAVQEGIKVGKKTKIRELNPYQETERKLYTYREVMEYIADCKEEIAEVEKYGLKGKSAGIVFMPSGSRLGPDDMVEAKVADLKYRIQKNEREIKRIDSALKCIHKDEYYRIIELKYIGIEEKNAENEKVVKRYNDEEIAELINCDRSTVTRNRNRLVSSLSARLYGYE